MNLSDAFLLNRVHTWFRLSSFSLNVRFRVQSPVQDTAWHHYSSEGSRGVLFGQQQPLCLAGPPVKFWALLCHELLQPRCSRLIFFLSHPGTWNQPFLTGSPVVSFLLICHIPGKAGNHNKPCCASIFQMSDPLLRYPWPSLCFVLPR